MDRCDGTCGAPDRGDAGRHAEPKAEHEVKKAQRAEEETAATIAVAAYCVIAAEYAVVQAALARAEADSLAGVN